jgi:hypothetical protein
VDLSNLGVDADVPDGEARGFRADGTQVCVIRYAPVFEHVDMAEGEVVRWSVSPAWARRL